MTLQKFDPTSGRYYEMEHKSYCPQCGHELGALFDDEPVEVKTCPRCGRDKCSACDMGNDVHCMACEHEDEV